MITDTVVRLDKRDVKTKYGTKPNWKVTLENGTVATTFEAEMGKVKPGDKLEYETEEHDGYTNFVKGFKVIPQEAKRQEYADRESERERNIYRLAIFKGVSKVIAHNEPWVPQSTKTLWVKTANEGMSGKKSEELLIKEQGEWAGKVPGDNHIDEQETSDTSVEVEKEIEEVGSPVATSDWGNCPDHGPMVESKYAPGRPFCNNKDKQDKWCKVWK